MSEDIEKGFMEAILKIRDEQQQAVFLLLFRLVRQVADSVDHLAGQMTIEVKQHNEDHRWITEKRQAEKVSKEDSHAIAVGVKKDLYSRASQVIFGLLCAGAGVLASLLVSVLTKGVS